jgi:hypothetical protein
MSTSVERPGEPLKKIPMCELTSRILMISYVARLSLSIFKNQPSFVATAGITQMLS